MQWVIPGEPASNYKIEENLRWNQRQRITEHPFHRVETLHPFRQWPVVRHPNLLLSYNLRLFYRQRKNRKHFREVWKVIKVTRVLKVTKVMQALPNKNQGLHRHFWNVNGKSMQVHRKLIITSLCDKFLMTAYNTITWIVIVSLYDKIHNLCCH